MKIAIASALDDGYTMPTVVMLYSLMENALEDTEYEIFLLVPHIYKETNKKNILNLKEVFPKHSICFCDMGDIFCGENIPVSHITYPTYYRLLLPEILRDWDRCIYLDGDTLILNDLNELYGEDLENYYVAGVKAPFYCRTVVTREANIKRLSIQDMSQYVNAGVLLMNLTKMRKDFMKDRFMEIYERNCGKMNDQDIINVQCYRYIKVLPFRCNYQVESSYLSNNELRNSFSEDELKMAAERPLIMHYSCSEMKPWKSLEYQNSDIWWEYFRKTPYAKNESEYIEKIEQEWEKRVGVFKEKLALLQKQKYIVLFGYSETSLELLPKLRADNLNVVCFCDNDVKKQGIREQGLKVLSLEQSIQKYPNAFYINTSQNYAKEIERQLICFGVGVDNILRYKRKGYWLDAARRNDILDIYL